MGNRKFRFLSLLLVIMLLSINLTACNKASSAKSGNLAAKHSCTDSRYEANNANLTDDALHSYYSTAN